MRYKLKAYKRESDYWKIRAFLREVFLKNNRRERGWQPYRFDYWRFHIVRNCHESTIHNRLFWWENGSGEIVSVIHSEGQNDLWLEIHPDVHSVDLEREMMRTGCEKLAREQNGNRVLFMWIERKNVQRCEIAASMGFVPTGTFERQRYADLTNPVGVKTVPADYAIRSLGGEEELPSRSWASWTSFHPNDPDEKYEGWEWYRNVQKAPLYRRDLDIVAVTPDGSVASFCTAWFDDATRTCGFEPLGTHKNHQRLGLAKAVLSEAMRRAQELGATLGTIGSWNELTDRLYGSLGFEIGEELELWKWKSDRTTT